jgi:eukaryotic-like serine/threonine-protein kinase
VLLCTPAYLAPERAAGTPATPAADLYALGIVAYQCLTGQVPFQGEPLAVALAHQDQSLPPLPPSVPADVAALVADLTAKDPAERSASAGEVAERAEQVRAALTATAAISRRLPARARAAAGTDTRPPGGPPPGRRATDGTRQRKQSRRTIAGRLARCALALAAIAVIAAAGWVMAGVHGPPSAHRPARPPSAIQPSSPDASHRTQRAAPAREPGRPSAIHAPGQDRRSPASSKPPAPNATPTPSRSAPCPGRLPLLNVRPEMLPGQGRFAGDLLPSESLLG